MTPSQVADLLTIVVAYDHRTVGKTDVAVWAKALEDVDFNDAQTAVHNHYRTRTDWIMPGHIWAGVKAIRGERLARIDHETWQPPPAIDGAPQPYLAWLRSETARIANGGGPAPQQVGKRKLPALEGVFRRVED